MTAEQRFRREVRSHLSSHTGKLIKVLRRLIHYTYPKDVHALDFEVAGDRFIHEFPVKVFFLDQDYQEYFITEENGEKHPLRPPYLLDIPQIYPRSLEMSLAEEEPELDIYSIAGEVLIPWFRDCWKEAGGMTFKLDAQIAQDEAEREYCLVEGIWRERF